MATGYAAQIAAANNPAWFPQVMGAVVAYAETVYLEATTVANHATRDILARAVALNPTQYVLQFAYLLSVAGLDNTSTDAVVLSGVTQAWNIMAGV